jgi:small conductance mechanosensitive channel
MEGILEKIYEWGALYGLKILGAIAILIIGRIVIGIIVKIVKKMMNRSKVDETLGRFILSIVRVMLLAILFIVILDQVGVETTSFVAILGAAGLAIGFALQGSLSNLAAGVMLIIFRPFKSGDFVEAGGGTGVIEEVGIFSTIMRTGDNKKVIIPNSGITGGNIVNYSAKDTRRIDFVFGIGYDDDIKKAKELFAKIVTNHPKVLKDPAPVIALHELADSSVNFVVRPWVKSADYWTVYWEITEAVKLMCDAEGISIPYPQQDVHMHQVESSK